MLRGNLATRPFYNQRLVTLVLLLVAVAVAALTVFNVREFRALSAKRGELNARIVHDRTEADRIAAANARLRQEVDLASLHRLAADTAEANGLIDERTFSWTSFFAVVQDALPYDVRLQAVTPRIEKGRILIRLVAYAKSEADLYEFIRRLQATKRFRDGSITDQQLQDDGVTWVAVLQGQYLPVESALPATPAGGRGRGQRP
jgi:hypothetical protein